MLLMCVDFVRTNYSFYWFACIKTDDFLWHSLCTVTVAVAVAQMYYCCVLQQKRIFAYSEHLRYNVRACKMNRRQMNAIIIGIDILHNAPVAKKRIQHATINSDLVVLKLIVTNENLCIKIKTFATNRGRHYCDSKWTVALCSILLINHKFCFVWNLNAIDQNILID